MNSFRKDFACGLSAEAPVRIQIVSDLPELEALVPEWTALWEQDPNATPFQRPEWLLPWWRHVGEGKLYTLALRDRSDRLIGLVPLYIYVQPANGERHLLLLGAGTSDYLDGVFAPTSLRTTLGSSDEPAKAALRFLAGQTDLWDRAILHQLGESSSLLRCARSAGWPVSHAEGCSGLAVNGWSSMPTKLHGNVGRYRRRAESRGRFVCGVATTRQTALDRLEDLIDRHTRRWQDRGEGGVLTAAAVQQHHREAVPKLLEAGLLRMFSAELDGQAIAVLYAFANAAVLSRARSLLCYLIGFDTEFADLSPGTLVLAYALDQCKAEGIAYFDMLRGGEAYKQLWGTSFHPTYKIEFGPGIA